MRPLGYVRAGDEFTDTRQGIVGVFLEGAGPRLELLCPLGGRDVLDPWLAGRAKMYHLAFEVQELATALAAARREGAQMISAPTPAVAFDDRRICFVLLRNLFLVELIQGPASLLDSGSPLLGADISPDLVSG